MPAKNHATVFNPFHRQLIDLSTELQSELLAFAHGFAVDDREMSRAIESNAGYEKRGRRNFTLRVGRAADVCFRFEADWPKRIARSGVDLERRLILQRDDARVGGWF